MRGARLRLTGLWLSQTLQGQADWALRTFVFLAVVRAGQAGSDAAWSLAIAVLTPFVLLVPLNGAVCNGLPRRGVLVGAAGFCLTVVVFFGIRGGPWLTCATLAAIGAAVYSAARGAVLPAAARDTGLPLARINGWIELGGAAAIVAGVALGELLDERTWFDLPAAVGVAAGLYAAASLAAWSAVFPSDVHRPERPGSALAGFGRDVVRVLRDCEARGILMGLACFLGLIAAVAGAVMAPALANPGTLVTALLPVGAGAAVGCGMASLQGHPRRSLGLVPLGAAGLLSALAWAALVSSPGLVPRVLLGLAGGLVIVPLRAAFQAAVAADALGNGMALLNAASGTAVAGLVGLLVALPPSARFGLLAVLAAAMTLVAGRVLLREVIELGLEWILWPIYRVRACGPGVGHLPPRGPLLVVANHAAWFDPIWLAKVLPRRVIPMMTSLFYDRPGLRWLMVHVARAIRVQDATYRREAPELNEAIKALDQRECLLIFPEGMLRRKDEQLLRQFGQGVWRILRARPHTPVVCCWIEGGWGSFTSYRGGPPTVNKRMDRWRRIDIALGEPQTMPPALLADPRASRAWLMQRCLEARQYLGLPPTTQPFIAAEEPAREDEKGPEPS